MRAQINNSRSGNVLVITLICLFLVTAATMGVLMVTANALHLTKRQMASATAFNIAESGAERAAYWLKNQLTLPTSNIDPFGGPVDLDDGEYQVTIYPHPDNPTAYLKTFRIVSIGTAHGVSKTIEIVVKQATFGRYAYFTDSEKSSITGGAIWWKAGEIVDGPVHSNNRNGSNFNINYAGSTAPIFLDMLTASGSTINYSPSRPRDEATFMRIFRDGSKGFKLGVPQIPLPPSSNVQQDAAWGSSYGFPNTNGVYLRAGFGGGIYIHGDAAIQLTLDSNGNQVIRVTQGYNVTSITLDKITQTCQVTGPVGPGSPTSAASLGTGVIYCTGNITSLSGVVADNHVVNGEIVVRNSLTIANNVNAGKYIKITNNLIYSTRPDKTKDSSDPVNLAAGTLGLVSKDIKIASTAPTNLEIDAVCLAGGSNTSGGSFYVENYNTKTPPGTLRVLGGIIQKARGPVGTFNPSTGVTVTGYAKNYSYDPRLAVDPPPYYPTTGTYERISWRVLPSN
ncbi:MAG: hypothetical protein ACUVT8_01280 [Armatimonadota bacterium]